jgi:ppGpp synthetase/RelA/SpoT-type nucleotidyltranferase
MNASAIGVSVPTAPPATFEKERQAFRDYYNDNLPFLQEGAAFFSTLVKSVLLARDLELDSVTWRVKDREECINKFTRKYRERLEQHQQSYKIQEHVTDILGIRVVCLYDDDTRVAAESLRRSFRLLGETDKTAVLEGSEAAFGYKGVHLDLELDPARAGLPEYRRYKDLRFEVQLRTIIQDAWSVLDHRIKYKKNIPTELRRQISGLAALFDTADREFLRIRDAARQALAVAESASESAAGPDPLLLDVFGFLGVAKLYFRDYQFHEEKADGFVQELLQLKPTLSSRELKDALARALGTVTVYEMTSPYRLNPFTKIRHALYMVEPETFSALLFDSQRLNFERSLEGRRQDR